MKEWAKAFTPEQLELRRQRAKKWRHDNKERAAATLAAYRLAHPDRVAATALKARKKLTARDPKYFSRNVDRFFAGRPWHKSYCYARSRCNPKTKNAGYQKYYVKAGVQFRITSDEVKALWFRDNAAAMKRPSLDRIYINGNYSIGNCRFMEQSDNASRRFNPDAELVAIERRKQRYQERLGALCAVPARAVPA